MVLPPPFGLMFGLFDLAITTFLGMATYYQTGYSPHHYSTCKWGGAEVWQVPNGTDSFFTVAGALNKTRSSAERMCRDYVEEWKYGVALTYMISSFHKC